MRALFIAWIVVMLVTARAGATGSRVVVLRDPSAPPAVSEAALRTEAELRAEGFDVVVRDEPTAGDVRATLERASSEERAVAAIAVVSDADGAAADLWVTDRITNKTSIRRVEVSQVAPAERPRALAIRAVELLRGSLVESIAAPSKSQPPARPPPDVQRWLEPPPRSPLSGPSAALAVGLWTGFDRIGPSGAPVVRLGWGADFGLGGRLTWLGPAYGARVTAGDGSARLRQELATLDLFYAPPVDWSGWTPIVWAGAGAYHLYAEGQLRAPLIGQSDEVWTFLAEAGLGMGYRLSPAVTAWLDVAAALTAPRAVVTLFGDPIGTMGRPALMSSLGVSLHF